MKVDISEKGVLLLKEIYCNTVLETEIGNRLAVCMRDHTVELCVPKFNMWYRVNMDTGEIYYIGTIGTVEKEKIKATAV